MIRNFNSAMTLAILVCLVFSACATRSEAPDENTPEEVAAAKLVLEQLKNALGDAYPTGLAHFEMGTLDEGCAVLLVHVNNEPINAAFWSQDAIVYAVNDVARNLNPALANAPEMITEERVRAVVH